ncbi:MAG: hypothetical protein BM564_03470 [Bacteroidetes bacterium MedPE-SWsnd-G2]|nr:MAG: hypothetical protein BM564_03470 [Bacteroidetes bacterium MedPE-SWsnd-G2]
MRLKNLFIIPLVYLCNSIGIAQTAHFIKSDCKLISSIEFSKFLKNSPETKFYSISEDGTPFTKVQRDSIVKLLGYKAIKQTLYNDTVSNQLFAVNKILSLEEQTQMKQETIAKKKEEKTFRKSLNGTKLSPLVLTDLEGNSYNTKDLEGKVIVFNFWFTQCKPCVAEFPDLNKLKAKFKDKDVVFFGVTFNSKDALIPFFENHKFDYTIIPNGNFINDTFKIPYYPYHIIIDKTGTIEYFNSVLVLNVFKSLERKINQSLKRKIKT